MKRIFLIFMSVFLIVAFSGCATIVTSKAERDGNGDLKSDSKGIRVYPTRVYLIVKEYETEVRYLPDYSQAYNIIPIAFLSKNNFSITITEGQIKSCGAAMDTSDAVKAATEIVKNADLEKSTDGTSDNNTNSDGTGGTTSDSVEKIKGNLGLEPGVYMFDRSGNIIRACEREIVFPNPPAE
jgi:hypothetical protein